MISVFIKFRLPWLKSVQRDLFVICIWLIFMYVHFWTERIAQMLFYGVKLP